MRAYDIHHLLLLALAYQIADPAQAPVRLCRISPCLSFFYCPNSVLTPTPVLGFALNSRIQFPFSLPAQRTTTRLFFCARRLSILRLSSGLAAINGVSFPPFTWKCDLANIF
ncbi:hypothetical protein SDJN02_05647, partial [Cucurbita argyrosperma subsp. argyrosperma]